MEKIASIGIFLIIAGIVSIILSFIDYNLRILMWIDLWGEMIAWGIRGGLIVLGGILFMIGKKNS